MSVPAKEGGKSQSRSNSERGHITCRLYEDAQERLRYKDRLKDLKEERQKAESSNWFTPKVNKYRKRAVSVVEAQSNVLTSQKKSKKASL